MRLSIIIFALLAFANGNTQNPPTELKFPEVGWTLSIPSDSKLLTTAQFDTLKQRVSNAMNKAYGIDEVLNEVRPLFTIREKQFNILGSTINLYDSSLFDTWQESYDVSKEFIIDLVKQQGGQIKITDTLSSTEEIDGLVFQKFYVKTIYLKQDLTMQSYWYYRKHGIYDFSINVSYVDEKIGSQFLGIIRSSRFAK